MLYILPLLLIFFPVAEIAVLLRVASRIGGFNTFVLLVFSAVFGVMLAQAQGQAVLQRAQSCLVRGQMPAAEMVDGMLLFAGGVLFVVPGFISDLVGLFLVFPVTRWMVKQLILAGNISGGSDEGAQGPKRPETGSSARSEGGIRKDRAQDAQIVE